MGLKTILARRRSVPGASALIRNPHKGHQPPGEGGAAEDKSC